MSNIEEKYLLKDGETVPEGYVVKTCEVCNRSFAMPADVAEKSGPICESSECKNEYERRCIEQTKALLKSDTATQTEAEIKTALGN